MFEFEIRNRTEVESSTIDLWIRIQGVEFTTYRNSIDKLQSGIDMGNM